MCSTHGICYHGLVLKGDVLEGTELPAAPSQCPCDHHMTNIQAQLSPLLVPNFKSIHMIKEVKLHQLTWEPCLMMYSSLPAHCWH